MTKAPGTDMSCVSTRLLARLQTLDTTREFGAPNAITLRIMCPNTSRSHPNSTALAR